MYKLTNRVGQALLIDKKQPKKVLTRDQGNWSPYGAVWTTDNHLSIVYTLIES